MARHSFIQMSKLSNVKGRISYISDPKRQEYLYATFSTREDMTFWNDLAKECQEEEFEALRDRGKCIEARELIIALPEEYTKFDPNQVLREFTEQFKKRYDVECVSALHHNKTKKNYHIHLIFSERRLLPEPEVKIATRSVFYDELGKRVRTERRSPVRMAKFVRAVSSSRKARATKNTCSRQRTNLFRIGFSWMKPSSSTPL